MAKKTKAKASKRTAKKASPRAKAAQKTAKKAGKKTAKKGARRAPAKTARRGGAAKTSKPAKKSARKTTSRPVKKSAKTPVRKSAKKRATPARRPASKAATPAAALSPARRANLDRERRIVREEDMVPSPPSSLDLDRSASAARTGRAEFEQRLRNHTSTGPAMTAGDVDADWEDAESVGEEAPGGDNPTPDQDVVEEIGRAVGIEYDDDEELQGGNEVAERDRHRWELDPASKDDVEEE